MTQEARVRVTVTEKLCELLAIPFDDECATRAAMERRELETTTPPRGISIRQAVTFAAADAYMIELIIAGRATERDRMQMALRIKEAVG